MALDRGVFPGQWTLPGGGVEPGEVLLTALEREVREEIGACVVSAKPLFFKDGCVAGRAAGSALEERGEPVPGGETAR